MTTALRIWVNRPVGAMRCASRRSRDSADYGWTERGERARSVRGVLHCVATHYTRPAAW